MDHRGPAYVVFIPTKWDKLKAKYCSALWWIDTVKMWEYEMNCKQKSRTQVEGNSKRRYWKIRWKYMAVRTCCGLEIEMGEKTVRLCVYRNLPKPQTSAFYLSHWQWMRREQLCALLYLREARAWARPEHRSAREGGGGGAWGLCTIIVPERGENHRQ